MGKIRRVRQKYHLTRAKSMNDISTIEKAPLPSSDAVNTTMPTFSVSSDLFGGIDIPLDCDRSLLRREEDARSIVTTKSSFRERSLSKLQRRTLRHDAFMKKLDVIQTLKNEARERKRRQLTVITGDMRPLADALPPLEYVGGRQATTGKGNNAPRKQRALPKAKQRQRSMLDDISSFRKVLEDPVYKTDPAAAISNYIQDKIQQELMDEM